MRSKLSLILAFGLLTVLLGVPSASARIELYASTPTGIETGFALGANNIISLRGSVEAPSNHQTIKVRQVDAGASCPSPGGYETPVYFEFVEYAGANAPLPRINVAQNPRSSERDSRFCVYGYFATNPDGSGGPGPDNPNVTYFQDVTFRDPTDTISWFSVASATSPERPFYSFEGSSETGNPLLVAFVNQLVGCPASFPGGVGAITLPTSGNGSFSFTGEANVQAGFWRACGYFQVGLASVLAKDTAFSRTPRGGWVPKYKFKRGTLRRKGGRWQVGTATCRVEAACQLTLVAKSRGKVLARGKATGKAGSKKALKLTLKPTSAGKKAARRGVKATITVTSVIDLSEVDRRTKRTLR